MTIQPYSIQPLTGPVIKDNVLYWQLLYDKYAPVMYGIILQITACNDTSAAIFKKAFLDLKNIQLPDNGFLYFYLWKYAGTAALEHMVSDDTVESKEKVQAFFKNCSPVKSLCFQNKYCKTIAAVNLPSGRDLQKKIRRELSERISA